MVALHPLHDARPDGEISTPNVAIPPPTLATAPSFPGSKKLENQKKSKKISLL
jgi:hypothetical protein